MEVFEVSISMDDLTDGGMLSEDFCILAESFDDGFTKMKIYFDRTDKERQVKSSISGMKRIALIRNVN